MGKLNEHIHNNRPAWLAWLASTRLARLAFVLTALVVSTNASAYYKLVFDPWTTAQVTANAAAQEEIEKKHNERLDTISAKQQKILQYTTTMETIKELYRISMTNVRGFGEETAYYKEMVELSADILMNVPTVTKFIAQNPGKNYILCLNELTDIVLETEGLVNDFVNIVNNGKVVNPLKKPKAPSSCPNCGGTSIKTYKTGGAHSYVFVCQRCGHVEYGKAGTTGGKNEGDGYNFMDRYTRLTLANRIYGKLMTIKRKMDAMVMMCQFGTWGDAFFAIDPESWAAVYSATNFADGLIMDWNRLGV